MARMTVYGFEKLDSTNYTGSDCTGNDGDTDRTLATEGVTLVVVDGMLLQPSIDYTVSGNTITFLNQIFDEQKITVWN